MRRVALLLACGIALAPSAGAATARPALQDLLDAIPRSGAPGATAVVVSRASTWRGASGSADLATGTPMRADSTFRVSSITKTFVATVVLQLVAENQLRLDDSVERWLPGALPTGPRVTVRDLLRHTSGLGDYTREDAFVNAFRTDPTRRWTSDELLALAARTDSGRPGVPPVYSNTNFLVLGRIVEAATGRSLDAELRSRIFEPLGLTQTFFATAPTPAPTAHGYLPGGLSSPPWPSATGKLVDSAIFDPSALWGSTNVVSSAPDLARFFGALLAGRLIPRALLVQMQSTVPGRPWRYGLGLLATKLRCGVAWGHWGYVLGYYTYAFFRRDGRRGVVVSTNTALVDGATGRAFMRFVDAAYCRALAS